MRQKTTKLLKAQHVLTLLRDYELLKFFQTSGFRAHNELVEYPIGLWDVGHEIFIVGVQEL